MNNPATRARYCVSVLCALLLAVGAAAQSQVAPATILYIDTENSVTYIEDIFDVSKFATIPGIVNARQTNFGQGVMIADIVAVNGQPVRGTYVFTTRRLTLNPAPNAGEAVADVARNGVIELLVEILKTDGTPIGTIMAFGLAMGSPPPGAPLDAMRGNNAIVGGTGAFLGARGQFGNVVPLVGNPFPARIASMAEDPANRRRNGGGRGSAVLHVIPLATPETVTTASGPVVFHSDYSPVTTDKAARSGETLILYAKGLGPTSPAVNPGDPFPSAPLAIVTSPVEVFVDGKSSPTINQIGVPGTSDTYRVDFQVPDGTAVGMVTIQLSAAWIKGAPVRIPVR